MEKSTFVGRHRLDDVFWLTFVATNWLAIFMGFWAPVAQRYAGKAPYPAPPILVGHVFVYVGWLVLFTAQVLLINRGRPDLHRRLGIAGMVLAVLVVVTGLFAEIYSQHFWARTDPENVRFFTFPLYVLIVFAGSAGLAFRRRRDAPAHKRLMFLAIVALMGGPYQRWWGPAIDAYTGTGWFNTWAHLYTGTNLLMILAALYDQLTRGSVHKVYRMGIPLIIAGELLVNTVWHTAWWPPLVRAALGIPVP